MQLGAVQQTLRLVYAVKEVSSSNELLTEFYQQLMEEVKTGESFSASLEQLNLLAERDTKQQITVGQLQVTYAHLSELIDQELASSIQGYRLPSASLINSTFPSTAKGCVEMTRPTSVCVGKDSSEDDEFNKQIIVPPGGLSFIALPQVVSGDDISEGGGEEEEEMTEVPMPRPIHHTPSVTEAQQNKKPAGFVQEDNGTDHPTPPPPGMFGVMPLPYPPPPHMGLPYRGEAATTSAAVSAVTTEKQPPPGLLSMPSNEHFQHHAIAAAAAAAAAGYPMNAPFMYPHVDPATLSASATHGGGGGGGIGGGASDNNDSVVSLESLSNRAITGSSNDSPADYPPIAQYMWQQQQQQPSPHTGSHDHTNNRRSGGNSSRNSYNSYNSNKQQRWQHHHQHNKQPTPTNFQ